MFLFDPVHGPNRQVVIVSTNEETEVLRGEITCPQGLIAGKRESQELCTGWSDFRILTLKLSPDAVVSDTGLPRVLRFFRCQASMEISREKFYKCVHLETWKLTHG